jgi:hypothetical protein
LVDSFDPNAINDVRAFALQADGKILVGGFFTSMGGQTRNRIALLNPDGSLDANFDPNANFFVEAVPVQADGKILVGGLFSSIGGQTRNGIAQQPTLARHSQLNGVSLACRPTARFWWAALSSIRPDATTSRGNPDGRSTPL